MAVFRKGLPYFAVGTVVKGFGRGSKELGIPTANFPESVVDKLHSDIATGIYYGFASVNNGPVHDMVMSIGWNPYYKNKKKSMETHIIHSFEKDFYGEQLRVIMLGYIRPEKNFQSLDDLIQEIHKDIETAQIMLEKAEFDNFRDHSSFSFSKESLPDATNGYNKSEDSRGGSPTINGYSTYSTSKC